MSVSGYLFGTLLDVVILLDRIATLNKKISAHFKFKPRTMILIAFAITIGIQFPWFFVYVPQSAVVTLNTGVDYEIWFVGQSNFAMSKAGEVILNIIFAVRDVGMMALEFALNLISVYLFKKYLGQKSKLLAEQSPASLSQPSDQSKGLSRAVIKNKHISKAESNATLMCIFMCATSVLEHIVFMTCALYPYFNELNQTTFFLYWLAAFSVSFKHATNFPLFYFFNKNFKYAFLKLIKLRE
jgi:hypothetical protein